MTPALRIPRYFYPITGGYAALLAVAFHFEFPWLALLPIVLGIAWLAFYRLDALMLLIVACVPLSLSLEDLEIGGIGAYLPTEPLLAGILLLFLTKSVSGWPLHSTILTHPLSRWVQCSLIWIGIAAIASSHPLVSFKFLAARLWFVVGFLWVLGEMFRSNKSHRHQFILAYAFPLCIVIIYTLVRHAGFGFEKDAGHWVMKPFYKDHTSYGAVLAMVIPPMFALLTWNRFSAFVKAMIALGLAVLCIGLVFSYTRAAWVSLAAVVALWGLMKLGVQLKTLLAIGLVSLTFLWFAQDALLIQLERNRQDSSDNLSEHVESISNVSSDASNLERLNRWNAALAMFKERPILGWGPGSYQFEYAPFQRSEDQTIISTNNADGGNAHSEYLGPLAEQGIPGLIFVLGLLGFCLHLGFKLHRQLQNRDQARLAMGVFLGLMTYFVHGVLNNYLDTDKASALFWGFFALLLVWDQSLELSKESSTAAAVEPSV